MKIRSHPTNSSVVFVTDYGSNKIRILNINTGYLSTLFSFPKNFRPGFISDSKTGMYYLKDISFDSSYQFYTLVGSDSGIKRIGSPIINQSFNNQSILQNYLIINGAGFCSEDFSCNKVNLYQSGGNIFCQSILDVTFNSLTCSISGIITTGLVQANITVDPFCFCGIPGTSANTTVANIIPGKY